MVLVQLALDEALGRTESDARRGRNYGKAPAPGAHLLHSPCRRCYLHALVQMLADLEPEAAEKIDQAMVKYHLD